MKRVFHEDKRKAGLIFVFCLEADNSYTGEKFVVCLLNFDF